MWNCGIVKLLKSVKHFLMVICKNDSIIITNQDDFDNIIQDENNILSKYKKLTISDKHFNSPIDNIPSNIEYIHIIENNDFNQPLDNLPYNLQELLIYSNNFNQSLSNLPAGLEILELWCGNFNNPLNNLPESLKDLLIHTDNLLYDLNNLPRNLVKLCFRTYEPYNISITNLPNTIKQLQLGFAFQSKIFHLPDQLQFLSLHEKYKLSNLLTHIPNNVLIKYH